MAGETRRFPWDDMIAVGLGLLRLSPRDFWTMTPIELGHITRALFGEPAVAPQRRALEGLMAMFPDIKERPTL